MEKSDIYEILNTIKNLHPQSKLKLDNNTITNWLELLNNFEKDAVINAILYLTKTQQYIPSISMIIKELQNTFDIRRINKNNEFYIWVRFQNEQETFAFVFNDRDKANELLQYLKSRPSLEEIQETHKQLQLDKNSTASIMYRKKFGCMMTADEYKEATYNEWRKRNK